MKNDRNKEFKSYIFDWDDNILHMNTKINMEKKVNGIWKKVEIPTSEFTKIRKDLNYRIPLKNGKPDYDLAYSNFRDNGEKGEDSFLLDCIEAIDNLNVGPSYLAFKKSLIEGNLMSIVTARGHKEKSLRKGVEYFLETQLTSLEKKLMLNNLKNKKEIYNFKNDTELIKKYLNICEFIGVSSEDFINSIEEKHIPDGHTFEPGNTELGKIIAVERFSKKCIKYSKKIGKDLSSIKIGFSDDDLGNVNVIKNIFKNRLKGKFPNVKFVIYDTSKNDDGTKNYKKSIH